MRAVRELPEFMRGYGQRVDAIRFSDASKRLKVVGFVVGPLLGSIAVLLPFFGLVPIRTAVILGAALTLVALVLLVISYNTEAATCSECNSAIRKVWHSETVGQLRYVGPLYVCSKCKAFESHMYLSD